MSTASSVAPAPAADAPVTQKPASRRRRVLLPLAGLLTAAALVIGSGADFVSSSVNESNSFTTGTLTQTNSKADSAIFSVGNLKPGDTVTGGVVLTNSGTLPASFTLTEDATNGFSNKSNLTLSISESADGTPLWSGTFGELTTAGPLDLGDWTAGQTREFNFRVTLNQNADNREQGKSAEATYRWDAVQAEATTYNQ